MANRLTLRFSTSANSPSNWASAVIRRLGHSRFSHCDFLLPDNTLLGASDQGPNSPCLTGNPRGIAIRPISYQKFGIRRDMILETDRADAVIEAAMSQLGKPFDASGMWGFLQDGAFEPPERDWRNIDSWWCSEHKAWSLEQGNFFRRPLLVPKTRVSPADLLLILMQDDRWINYETFDQPIPGLEMDPGER